MAKGDFPERLQTQSCAGAVIALDTQAAQIGPKRLFAQLVIPEGGSEVWGEAASQFAQTLRRARKGGGIAYADKARVAGIVAIRDHEIGRGGLIEKQVQQMIMRKGIALPEIIAIEADGQTPGRVGNRVDKKIPPRQVRKQKDLRDEFQQLIKSPGVEPAWS